MNLSLKTLKMLWGRAAGRCSYPTCRMEVVSDESEASTLTLIGENCHIVSAKDRGPRSEISVPPDQINSYDNLILMCRNHHKIIDDSENGERNYPIEKLQKIKREHEAWVSSRLELDIDKQKDEESYAEIVDEWEKKCSTKDWLNWTGAILSAGQPRMSDEVSDRLLEARSWLLSRVWPGRYPSLEAAFKNFQLVLEDFHKLFLHHAELCGDTLLTKQFYHIKEWDEEKYHLQLQKYEYHVRLVGDLVLELTRAANLICDEIRINLIHSYLREEGRLMVESGPYIVESGPHAPDLIVKNFTVQYTKNETRNGLLYSDLDKFQKDRSTRDFHFGSG